MQSTDFLHEETETISLQFGLPRILLRHTFSQALTLIKKAQTAGKAFWAVAYSAEITFQISRG